MSKAKAKRTARSSLTASQLPGHQLPLVAVSTKGVVAMDQPYSLWADWLSKFHTWPEFIQAQWVVAIPVTVLGLGCGWRCAATAISSFRSPAGTTARGAAT